MYTPTVKTLEKLDFKILEYPYSLDFAPSDLPTLNRLSMHTGLETPGRVTVLNYNLKKTKP